MLDKVRDGLARQVRVDDHGGSAVIRRHEDALTLFEISPDELRDVDTPMALAALRDTLA